MAKKIVAFDTETKGLNWFNEDEQAFLITWADEKGEYLAHVDSDQEVGEFLNALSEADIIVAHNLPFDVHQVREATGTDILNFDNVELHDTDIMSRVLFPEGQRKGERGGHGLKNLAKVWIDDTADEPEKDIERMADELKIKLREKGGYWQVWRAYPEVMEKYARMDARYTRDLFPIFMTRMHNDEKAARIYELERAVQPILIRAEQIGIALDQDAVQKLKAQYEQQEHDLADKLARELGETALGGEGSDEALLDALQSIGVPLYRRTEKTGKLSTNKFALAEFIDSFPILGDLEDYRTAKKFLSTYIGPMIGREVVHTSFMQLEAWTGRSSARRPNMQNIPKRAGKEVRSMFVPRPGYVFLVSDYESIEAKLLAYYLGDEDYRELVATRDPHAWMAQQIHGGTVEQYEKGTDGQPLRDAAKNVTYAISYGGGGKRITDMLGLDPGPVWDESHPAIQAAQAQGRQWPKAGPQYHEAKRLIKTVKSSLPGFYELNRRLRAKIEAVGYVNTLFGRKNPVKKDKAYVGLNAIIQGSGADIMKQGLVNTAHAIAPYGGYVLLVVHDEILSEVPIEHAEAALEAQNAAMVAAYELNPPLTVEGGIVTTNYSEA